MGKRLFFGFSFLALAAASIYCLSVVSGFALGFISNSNVTTENSLVTESALSSENVTSKSATEEKDAAEAVSSSSSAASLVPAAASDKAKGKIAERTIDSSAANLKYQKIYIKNNTSLTVDLKTELLTLPKLKIADTSKPQVLIVHTHTTECYMSEERSYYTESDSTRTTDESKNIVAVGNILTQTLERKGIGVIHATEKHDYPEYTGSYSRAEDTIKKYLKKYPTIKVVVDLHRDSVTAQDGTKSALVTEINGKKAAQVMIVSGCQDKGVTGFPNWKENFRLAIRLQQTMEVMYPTLARPILFTPRKYNQHLTTGSLLIECGTEANTLDQAKYSAELLGTALASTLNLMKE